MESYTTEEYSSGCESGWTVYFEPSRGFVDDQGCVNRLEEEDLSMVSDASSGPAQVSQDNNTNANCRYSNGEMFYSVSTTDEDGALVRNKHQKRSKKARPGDKRVDFNQDLMLDDTASSVPDFNYSSMNIDDQAASSMQKMMDLSQDHFSTSYFQSGATSSATHTHHYDHQVHFHQQYYNW